MAIKGMFFDAVKTGDVYDREYSSGDFSDYLHSIVGNGVFADPSTQLQVRAGTGMQVIVSAGEGWIEGHKLINSADYPLTLPAADPLLARIHRIIFYVDYTTREMGIDFISGDPAISPTAPGLTRDINKYQMCLAEIYVDKQTTAITQGMITDTRGFSNICGWVTGLIEQVDTQTLFEQWSTAFSDYYDEIKQELDDFMETLTEELRVNTYVKEFRMKDTFTKDDSPNIAFGPIQGYTYNATDIFKVYINGLLIDEDEYRLSATNAYVDVTLLSVDTSKLPPSIINTLEVIITKSVIGIENL